jgi:hypothetical protein
MKSSYVLVPPAEWPETPPAPGAWRKLVALYGSLDPRSLGALRIALGSVLAVDVALKFGVVEAHLSNSGWLTNHFALFRPMSPYLFSVYFAFGSPHEVKLVLLLHLLVCLLLTVGYRTKLMQLLALLLTTSLNSRNILIENGGSVVLNLLLVWTAFLPLGARFSVDALVRALGARQETSEAALNDRRDPPRARQVVVSLAATALLLQWAIIYGFNALQKNGAPWRDGSAVYYFLQQERLVTWFGAWLHGVLPLGGSKLLTFATLLIEGAIPLLLLSPWRPRATRLWAFGLAAALHLGIDAVLQLGSFSWAMLVAFVGFIPAESWERASRFSRARRSPCVVHFDPESGASLGLCRLLKRLDTLGLVTFRALDASSPKRAQKTLCVSVGGTKLVAGWQALLAAFRALPCGAGPLRLLAPFLRRRCEKLLAALTQQPHELDLELGLAHLPAQADSRAAEPSPARELWRGLLVSMREAVVLLLLVVSGSQVLVENPIVPAWLRPRARLRVFEAIVTYPRIFQGWSMFAPAPPDHDGRLVIDGRTKDGRRFDPLTGREPVFEVHPSGAPRDDIVWGYFHLRIAEDRFSTYLGGVREFVMNHHKLTGRPQDELRSFEAYYVSQAFPPPGAVRKPPERRLLFSSSPSPGDAPLPARPRSKPAKPRAQ